MKRCLFFIFCLGCILNAKSQPDFQNSNSAVGKTFKKINDINVFKNYKEEEAVAITDSKEHRNAFYKITDGSRRLVVFTTLTPQGNKILAILDIGKIEKNMRVLLRECRVNGKTDGFVVALVGTKPWKAHFTNVIKAWRVDQIKNTFVDVPTKGIDCLNEEFENED